MPHDLPPPPGSPVASPSGPPPPPARPDDAFLEPRAPVERPQRTSLRRLPAVALVASTLVAVLAQLALRVGGASLVAAIAITAAAALVTFRPGVEPRASHRAARVAAAAAVVFALLLPLRASSWLTWLNGLVALGCLVGAAVLHNGPPLRLTTGSIRAVLRRIFAGVEAPGLIVRSLRPTSDLAIERVVPVARGIALAAVPVLVFGALLASADAVFADAIALDLRIEGILDHGGLTVLCLVALVALLAVTGTPSGGEEHRTSFLGGVEASILLGAVALLFAAFALTQLGGALGIADAALERQGISHADYARSGFFQLLWVAALTAALLVAVRLVLDTSATRFDRVTRMLGALVSLLTVLIVASAIVRLGLYTDAFGQTTLRWYSTAFAWLLGAGFILGAAGHHRVAARYLPLTLVSLTAMTLMVCNVINPEARVAAHNLDRLGSPDAVEFDVDYVRRLSADAWPVLLEHRDEIEHMTGSPLTPWCLQADRGPGWGVLGTNLARLRLDCLA